MINTRTRAGQERHGKLALTFCPLKKKKNKHTRYKNNYYYNCYNARNNARCTQARKTTHGLGGQHQDVDRTLRGTVRQNDRGQG